MAKLHLNRNIACGLDLDIYGWRKYLHWYNVDLPKRNIEDKESVQSRNWSVYPDCKVRNDESYVDDIGIMVRMFW